MRAAVTASALGHALVIGWGLVSLPFAEPLSSLEKPLPVDIVSVEEFTKITAGVENAEPKEVPAPPKPKPDVAEAERETEKPEAPKTERSAPVIADAPKPEPKPTELRTAALPPEPAPEPEPAAEPAPAPEPEPAPAAEAEPAPQPTDVPVPPARPKIAEKPKPQEPKPVEKKPEPKPEPKKQEVAEKPKPTPPAPAQEKSGFDADKIAALLNKVPQSGGAPTGVGTQDPGRGVPDGVDMTLSMSEIDALRRQIAQCWSPPIGVLEAGHMVVKLGLSFNPDGTLRTDPQILNSGGQQIFMIAAEAARRAVITCQPYNLPVEKYDLWQEVHVNFDPRQMLGG